MPTRRLRHRQRARSSPSRRHAVDRRRLHGARGRELRAPLPRRSCAATRRALRRDEEARLYGVLLAARLDPRLRRARARGSVLAAARRVRQAFFQTTSLMTGTGFAITDYASWPTLSVMAMIGADVRRRARRARRRLGEDRAPPAGRPHPAARAAPDDPSRARDADPVQRPGWSRSARCARSSRSSCSTSGSSSSAPALLAIDAPRLERRPRHHRRDRRLGRARSATSAPGSGSRGRWGATSRSATSRSS